MCTSSLSYHRSSCSTMQNNVVVIIYLDSELKNSSKKNSSCLSFHVNVTIDILYLALIKMETVMKSYKSVS